MAKKPSALSKLQYSQAPEAQSPAAKASATTALQVQNENNCQSPIGDNLNPMPKVSHVIKEKRSLKFGKKGASSPLNKLGTGPETSPTIVNNTAAEQGSVPTYPSCDYIPDQDQPIEASPATMSSKVKARQSKQTKKKENKAAISAASNSSSPSILPATEYASTSEIDYDQLEAELERDESIRTTRAERSERFGAILHRISVIALVTGCVYLLFLIYGVLNTEYVYNDQGKLVPQILSVEQIRARDDFEKVQSEYLQARRIYEQVLELDYRIAAGVEDPLLIAPEYEEVLNMVDDLLMQCQAMSVSDRYKQTHDLLIQWLGGVDRKQSIATYCQNMSQAISLNDPTAASHALEEKQTVYNMFSTITANLTTLGKTVEGVDLGDIPKWSPEKYINEAIGGIGGDL